MKLEVIDWAILIIFFIILLSIGFFASKRAGKSVNDFFLSGRNMPLMVFLVIGYGGHSY